MAIVFVPGFMLDADLWSELLAELRPRGPVVHADPRAGSMAEMAAATLAAAPERFALVGFSMGGYVAREMQRRAPERVSRLVLIATSARSDTALQARRQVVAANTDPGAFRGLSRRSLRGAVAPGCPTAAALVERMHAMSRRLGGETFRRQCLFRREGDLERLAGIGCPTLIVAGREDRVRSLEELREMAAAIPGAETSVLEAGHMIPLEAPRALSSALGDFLGPEG